VSCRLGLEAPHALSSLTCRDASHGAEDAPRVVDECQADGTDGGACAASEWSSSAHRTLEAAAAALFT
jgi:hypothetical protein